MNQVTGLCQDEKAFCFGRLNLGQLLPEILDKYIVKSSRELHGLFANQPEGLIQLLEGTSPALPNESTERIATDTHGLSGVRL